MAKPSELWRRIIDRPIPVGDLDERGVAAPIVRSSHGGMPAFRRGGGALRYQSLIGDRTPLDALVVNQGSDVLVVSLHGALNRDRFTIPRFERLKSLLGTDVSSMYFSDPALHLDRDLQLAWFTGWSGVDVFDVIAGWTVAAARAIGARHVIFSGSSGGGFAALQISALVPNSVALAFNPQTSISAYLGGGTSTAPVRTYLRCVWPELADQLIDDSQIRTPWPEPLAERAAATVRYSTPTRNHVVYVNNVSDFHVQQHFKPFYKSARAGDNVSRITVINYEGSVGHAPPSPTVFLDGVERAVRIARSMPYVAPTSESRP